MNGNIHPEAAQLQETLRVEEVMEKDEEDKQAGGDKVVKHLVFRILNKFPFEVHGRGQGRVGGGGQGGVQGVHHEVGHPRHVRVLLSLQRLPVDTAGEILDSAVIFSI